MDNEKDENGLTVFLDALHDDLKKNLPAALLLVKPIGLSNIPAERSAVHNTDVFACYWFYKPISKTYKTFENE